MASRGSSPRSWKSGRTAAAPPQATAEMARQLRSLRRLASPLNPAARPTLEAAFGCDFHDVRIHIGPAAAELADQVGAIAFCCGSDIVLGVDVRAAPASVQHCILQHELAHAAFGHRSECIYCWHTAGHKQITRDIAKMYVGEGSLLEMLVEMSTRMDWRPWRIIKLVPDALLYGVTYGATLGHAHTNFPPPEGPKHGEGGYYKHGLDEARGINEKYQNEVVQDAARLYKRWEAKIRAKLPPGEPFYLKDSYFKGSSDSTVDWVERLGDALHIAQDRGSHWEGTALMGHRDPRRKFDTDDPIQNPDGYNWAHTYSTRVMEEFVRLTNFPAHPQGVWHCGVRDCPTHSAPGHRCATGVWLCGCRSPVCPGHSSPSHRCSKERGRAGLWPRACPANHPKPDDLCKSGVWCCGRREPPCPGHSKRDHRCEAGAALLNWAAYQSTRGGYQVVDLETPV